MSSETLRPVPGYTSKAEYWKSLFFKKKKKKKKDYLFLERGEGREKERETSMHEININWLPLAHPKTGTWPATQHVS